MQIVHYPHPTLRRKSKPLRTVNAELKELVRQMFSLMYEAKGVGLAANQVDLPFQLFVVNEAADPEHGEELVFINPVLSKPKGKEEKEEGCLSLPGVYGAVVRPTRVHVSAYSLDGLEIDQTYDGMLARIIQHEFDHLHGTLFIDRLNENTKKLLDDELQSFKLEFAAQLAVGKVAPLPEINNRLKEFERKFCQPAE